jgi:hypothetical protein
MARANNTMYEFTNVSREIISINLVAGVGTRITNPSAFLNGVHGISEVPVPEPGVFLLTGFGLIEIALRKCPWGKRSFLAACRSRTTKSDDPRHCRVIEK